jgi:hypothetical protein
VKTSCLNLPGLRHAAFDPARPERVSRRTLLGMAGVAAVAVSPVSQQVRGLINGSYEVREGKKRIAFRLAGRDVWLVDAAMFGGSPCLSVNRYGDDLTIGLTGAFFPGTTVPADFEARITHGMLGAALSMQFALGHLSGDVPLEPWLAGHRSLELAGNIPVTPVFDGHAGVLSLAGASGASFSPGWELVFDRDASARLIAPGMEVTAHLERLALTNDQASFLRAPTRWRSVVTLQRIDQPWSVQPLLSDEADVRFLDAANCFDRIEVECASPARGGVRRAIVAGQQGDARVLTADLVRTTRGFTGALFLSGARYAVGTDGRKREFSVVGSLARQPSWLSDGTMGLEVDPGEAGVPFACVWDAGDDVRFHCAPPVRRTLLPLRDAIAEPSALVDSRTLTLEAQQVLKKDNAVQSPSATQVNPLLLNSRIAVIRAEDLVRLDFELRNMKLEGSGTKTLVRDDPSKVGLIIVHFPPQHILEKAYFETDNAKFPVTNTPGKPADPDKGKSGDETPPDPPVPSRISGPSRVVFRVAAGAPPIEYSLKGLLEACRTLPLNVTGAAGVLTKKQAARFEAFQKAAALHNSITGIRQSAGVVRSSLATKAATAAVHDAVKALDDNIAVLKKSPASAQLDTAVMKRIDTLRNAAAYEAMLDPDLAAMHAASLESLLTNIAQPGFMETAPPAVSPGVISQVLKPSAPDETSTALEVPSALVMSPNSHAGWMHQIEPVVSNGRIELWHTRLGVRGFSNHATEGLAYMRTLRALWSPHYNENAGQGPGHLPMDPFRASLDKQDHHELVHLTAGFHHNGYEPQPVDTELLMLSGLGAWMHVVGDWDWPVPQGLSIEHWRHRATMGRDHFVRVVYAGFLFPFGHRASLIKITERKFQLRSLGAGGKKVPVAYLRQRMYIVVKEREKIYPAAGHADLPGGSEARRMPFRRIRITTLITPNLGKPEDSDIANKGQSAFWPMVNGLPFSFHCIGEDWEGRPAEFALPVLFLDRGVTFDGSTAGAALTEYMQWKRRRSAGMQGQRVAFADPSLPGDTSFETDSLLFGAEVNTAGMGKLQASNDPPFYPTIEEADVHISPVEQLMGSAAAQTIVLDPAYIQSGFDGNKNRGEMFISLKKDLAVDFAADSKKGGGLVTPSLAITGLSRKSGAVGGSTSAIASGSFDPMEYFKSALSDAKIIGGIPLYTLIDAIPDISLDPGRMPRMVTETSPEYLRTTLTWSPRLRTNQAPSGSIDAMFDGIFVPKDPLGGMTVHVELLVPRNGGSPVATVRSELKNFELRLLPAVQEFMALEFNKAVFTITPGNKVDIDVEIKDLKFMGALSFVNQILTVVDTKGFSDPPYLDISTSGIVAGYTLSIPTIAVGAFSIQNISLGARLGIPFDGKPLNVGFDFCARENPFLLTVSVYGGGGFFGITISPRGVMVLEASLEFGAAIAINLGVAKGGVQVMGGFYFMKSTDSTHYEAYVRIAGALSFLGIVTISVEFYLGLSYTSDGKMEGKATIKVKVEIAFFSKTVSASTSRRFKGSSGDPLFKDTTSADEYALYRAAFASE